MTAGITPTPVDDETLVLVVTPLGQAVGSFCWPTSRLGLLDQINESPQGYYFCWNEEKTT